MAAPLLDDRVKETTTSTGTGDLTLAGAESKFQSFDAAFGTGAQFLYTIVHQSASEWETGVGQLTTSTNFQRDTVIASTNSGAAVSFTAGTKDVFCAPVGGRAALLASGGRLEPTHATGLVLIETQTVSGAVSSVDFTTGIDSTYDEYVFRLQNVVPASDAVQLYIRTSTDAGSNWDSGASDYAYTVSIYEGNTVASDNGSDGAAQITTVNGGIGSDTNETGVSGWMQLFRPSAAEYTQLRGAWVYHTDTANRIGRSQWSGQRLSAADVTGVRFLMSSGNIESGVLSLYGVVN